MALTTTDKQLPYLALQKEPALTMQELYIKYPDGGEFGWYAFVKEIGSFAYWDVESKSWKGDKALVFKEEAETARDAALQAQEDAEKAKDDAVIAKGQAQEAQTAAEGFAGDAFQSMELAGQAKVAAETAQGKSEDAQIASETAKGLSETARDQSVAARNEAVNLVSQVGLGTPKDTFTALVDLQTADPDHQYIYLVISDGHWYYWDETEEEWADGGAYQAALDVVGELGESETDVMSQKAVSDEFFLKQLKTDSVNQKLYDLIATGHSELANQYLTQTPTGSTGSNTRNTIRRYLVTPGEKIFLVGSTYCESAFAVYGFSAISSITGAIIQLGTTGTGMITMDDEITVPEGAKYMMVTLHDNCSLVLARKNQIAKLNTLTTSPYDIDKYIPLGIGYYDIRTALAAMTAVTDDVRYISFNNGTKKVTYKYIGSGTTKDLLYHNWIKVDEDMSILTPLAFASGKYINTSGIETSSSTHWRKFNYNANTKYYVEAMVAGSAMGTFSFFAEEHNIVDGTGFLGYAKKGGSSDEYIEGNLDDYAIVYKAGVTAEIFINTAKYIYVSTRYSDTNSIQSHLYKRFVTEDIALSQNPLISSISDKVDMMRQPQIKNIPLPRKQLTETLKILYVGSSWMQDNAVLVRNVALASGLNVKVGNWYKGSCSYQDLLTSWEAATQTLTIFEADGTNSYISNCAVKTAITNDNWDIIVMANSANNSFDWTTYGQYYKDFLRLVKMYASQATIATYQGWVFQTGMNQSRWDISLEVFKKSVIQSGIDVTIPTGMALWSMLSTAYGADPNIMYRGDQTHLSYGFGRYIAACTNFVALITPVFGVSVLGNTYRCADVVGTQYAGYYTITEQQALDCQLFALSANGNRFEFIDMDMEL